jgi:NDP-sugar pyrophosphorylase family protein
MMAALLAGGLGTRLRSVVADRPKGLAEIGGRAFLEILLAQVRAAAVRKVVLCTGYLGHQIRSYFGGRHRGLKLVYSEETQPLGTAGALRLALPLFSSESVLVLNGDSYYLGELAPIFDWHFEKKAAISILLAKVGDTGRYGNVETASSGQIEQFREKESASTGSGWVNAGVYLIQRDVIQTIPDDRPISLEREVFPSFIGRGLYGYRGQQDFLDIGTPESYAQALSFIRRRHQETATGTSHEKRRREYP